MTMDKNAPVLIVGHDDVIERALCTVFRRRGFASVVSSSERGLPLLEKADLRKTFESERPAYVVLTSVRSGGIGANRAHPAEFIHDNIVAQTNVIDLSYRFGVKKLLYLAASCVYPKECPQPMTEAAFLSGKMEPTSEPYSMAKAAGVVMCQAYRRQYGFPAIVAVPATIYGPAVEHDLEDAHVMGAMIGKFRRAVRDSAGAIELWGTGKPRREFLYGDDLAEACLFLMERYDAEALINVGAGDDIEIRALAELIQTVSGFKGKVAWDASKPDGAMQKLLDSSRIFSMGWRPQVDLAEGIRRVWNGAI